LTIYELADEAAVQEYARRNDGPAEGRNRYTRNPIRASNAGGWRHFWRRVAPGSGSLADEDSTMLRLIANQPRPDIDPFRLAEFNQYYTDMHVPGIVDANGWLRGTRFELVRDFVKDQYGVPRFLAVYEGNEESSARQAARHALGQTTEIPGPKSWDERTSHWRFRYRRLHVHERP
jgi:hypothetical protein